MGNRSHRILTMMANGSIPTTKLTSSPTYLLLVTLSPLIYLSRYISTPVQGPYGNLFRCWLRQGHHWWRFFMTYLRYIRASLMDITASQPHRLSMSLVPTVSTQSWVTLFLESRISMLSYRLFVLLLPWSATSLMFSPDVTAPCTSRNLEIYFSSNLTIFSWRL